MNRLGQQSQFGQRGAQGLHVQPQQSGIGGHLGFGDINGRQGSIVQSGYGQNGPRAQQPGLFTAGVGVNGGWQGNSQQGGHGQQAYSVNDGHCGDNGYNDENDAEEEHSDEEDDDGWGEEDEEDWNEVGDEHGGGEVGHLQPNYPQQGAPNFVNPGLANQGPWNASVGNPNVGNLGYGYQGNVNGGGPGFANPNHGYLASPGFSNPGYSYPGYSYPGYSYPGYRYPMNAPFWSPGHGNSGPGVPSHGWGGHGPPVQNAFTPDSVRIAQVQQMWHGNGHAGQQQRPVYYQEVPANQSYNVLPNRYIEGPAGQQSNRGGSSGQRWQNQGPVRGQSNYRGTHRGSGRGRYRGSRRRKGDQPAWRRRRKEKKRALQGAAGSLSHLASDIGIPKREPVEQMPDDIQEPAPPTPRVKDEVVVKEEVVVKREESD